MAQCKKCKKDIPEGADFCPWCGKRQGPTPRKHKKRANGMGSVYKLPGNRSRPWCAARQGITIGYYTTRKEAEEALSRLVDVKLSELYNLSFAEVYERWKVVHYAEIGTSGQSQYDEAFTVFSSLHDRRWRDLRTDDFQKVLDEHVEKSVNTVSKYKQLITQMGDWAVQNELTSTNFASFAKARGRPARSHEPMTEEEVARIMAAADAGDETARIVVMMLSTGVRISELFGLPLADYHGDHVIGGEKTEEGRGRIIPIRPEGRPHFAYFAARANELLLDGYSGNKSAHNFRKRNYYALLDRLGISRDKTPHSTRVTYITQSVSDGLSPAVLQKVVGHADFDTTQKYYNKPSADVLVDAVEQASAKKPKNK